MSKRGWKPLIDKLRGKTSRRGKTRLLALRVARWLDYSGGRTTPEDAARGLGITPVQLSEAMRELSRDHVAALRGGELILLRSSKMGRP